MTDTDKLQALFDSTGMVWVDAKTFDIKDKTKGLPEVAKFILMHNTDCIKPLLCKLLDNYLGD